MIYLWPPKHMRNEDDNAYHRACELLEVIYKGVA